MDADLDLLLTTVFVTADDLLPERQKNAAIAIAISSLLDDDQRRAFSLTFNENGLALIEMHLGDLHAALRLVDAGLYRKLGRYDDALAEYGEAIRLSPPYPEAYYNRADLALALGDLEGALADLSRVLELDPAFPNAHLNRASVLAELGDLDGAARDIAEGLDAAPDDAHLHALLGDLLGLRGRPDEADAAYATALERDPSLVGAWTNRAVLAFEHGRTAAAIDYLTRALQAGGPDATILANRALAYEYAGRADDAIADLAAALEHETDPDERALLGHRIEALRAT